MSPVRLIFTIEGETATLVSAQEVDMTIPAGDEPDSSSYANELWAEVRTSDEEVLHRLNVPDLRRNQAEVFSGEPDGRPHWEPVGPSTGAFTIVVPSLPAADHVALVEGRPVLEAEEGDVPSTHRVLASFSLLDRPGQRS